MGTTLAREYFASHVVNCPARSTQTVESYKLQFPSSHESSPMDKSLYKCIEIDYEQKEPNTLKANSFD